MELVDRYVRLLRLFLPRRQRDDIAREISEEIRDQILDREGTLGRRLTVDEQGEVIGRYGHPLVTAARHRPQQHLIGPIVFPYYWMALKFVLALMLFGHVLSLAVVLPGAPSWLTVGQALESTVQHVFAVVAWFTVLAAAADRWLTRTEVLQRWARGRSCNGRKRSRERRTWLTRSVGHAPLRGERQRRSSSFPRPALG
jgi:hypothetical protein